MPYIPLESHLPGVTGLLEYRKDTGAAIRELTQILMRGSSTLSEGERELIATMVSNRNECKFCSTAHAAIARAFVDESITTAVKENIETAPVSAKMKTLLAIAAQVQASGKDVTTLSIREAKDAGATDMEIHDTVLIAALFCLYNRYVDGLATVTPADPAYYDGLAARIQVNGYNRLSEGYDHLKKDH